MPGAGDHVRRSPRRGKRRRNGEALPARLRPALRAEHETAHVVRRAAPQSQPRARRMAEMTGDDPKPGPMTGAPMLAPTHTYATITEKISSIVLSDAPRRGWLFGFALSFLLLMVLLMSIAWLFSKGIGIWGVNEPVG